MNIKIIGSGSSGNCYRIDDGNTALLIEAGLPIRKIKEGCGFEVPGACLVTHEHGDHSKAVRDLMKAGVDVYMTSGTAKALGVEEDHRLRILSSKGEDWKGRYRYFVEAVGSFYLHPFPIHHDAVEPVGFAITSQISGERLLFMTDSYYTEYLFPDLTHIMIEANYTAENLQNDPRAHRLRRSHMSIEMCIETLKANDLSRCREIWLLHLSAGNADIEDFKRRVQEATGCPVYIA